MSAGLVDVRRDGHVVEIALANPPLNLVTLPLLRDLRAVLAEVARSDARCVILHGGSARVFCAGSDMKEFSEVAASASELKILPEDLTLRMLARLPMPTVAAIDGPALGGGLELALACDLRVARAGSPIGLPESRIGGLAGSGAVRLARLVGAARAKELLFLGEPVPAETALQWGIVNRVSEDSALAEARTMATAITERGPLSNRLAKRLVDDSLDEPIDAALVRSTVDQAAIFASADLHSGAAAFFAKSAPEFAGR